jgi:hypothetical protein
MGAVLVQERRKSTTPVEKPVDAPQKRYSEYDEYCITNKLHHCAAFSIVIRIRERLSSLWGILREE